MRVGGATHGRDFAHKVGDIVSVVSPKLSRLQNEIIYCAAAEPWTFGAAALMCNLAKRKLI